MRLNLELVNTMYGAIIDGETYKYGWYKSGKAYISKNGELLNFHQACKLKPKNSFNLSDRFFDGLKSYKFTLDGIVRYLIEKYNR